MKDKALEELYKRLKNKDWTYMCAQDKVLIMDTIKQALQLNVSEEVYLPLKEMPRNCAECGLNFWDRLMDGCHCMPLNDEVKNLDYKDIRCPIKTSLPQPTLEELTPSQKIEKAYDLIHSLSDEEYKKVMQYFKKHEQSLEELKQSIIDRLNEERPHLKWEWDNKIRGFIGINERGHLVHNVTSYRGSKGNIKVSLLACDISLAHDITKFFMELKR